MQTNYPQGKIKKVQRARAFSLLEWILLFSGILSTCLSIVVPGLSVLYLMCWAFLLAFLLRKVFREYRFEGFPLFAILLFICFSLYCCVMCMATGKIGYISGFYLLFCKSLLLYFAGVFLGCSFRRIAADSLAKSIAVLLNVYIVASLILSLIVFVRFFPGWSAWLSAMEYLFESKNSFGQIAGVASVISLSLVFSTKKKSARILYTAMSLMLFAIVLFMQCRTAVLACVMAYLFSMVVTKHLRLIVAAAIIIVAFIIFVPVVNDVFVHALFLDKYADANLNTLSSGRGDLWMKAIGVISANPLFGSGSYYVDNMYLCCLANVGIFGFVFIMGFWLFRVSKNLRLVVRRKRQVQGASSLAVILGALTIFYLVESALEGWPPLGCGTSSFFFWLLCGLSDVLAVDERWRYGI